MRAHLTRATLTAVGVALGVLGVPVLALLVWLRARPPVERGELVRRTGEQFAAPGLVLFVALLVLAVLAATVVARRQAVRLAAGLAALAGQAEQMGRGGTPMSPVRTGLAELDEVSRSLARSSQQVAVTSSRERNVIADASHQLRTPLTAVLMRLEEIVASDDLDLVHEEANDAIEQVERLTAIVEELLSRNRTSSGPVRVSLDSVLAGLQREWQPAYEKARRSIRVTGERGLVVEAAPVPVAEVLSTLLENSLAHGEGTVGVEVRRSGPSVVVEVSDEGTGIPAVLAPHVFERSVSSTGSGIGLALARDLAESEGGRLELLSASPAVFALFLSAAPIR